MRSGRIGVDSKMRWPVRCSNFSSSWRRFVYNNNNYNRHNHRCLVHHRSRYNRTSISCHPHPTRSLNLRSHNLKHRTNPHHNNLNHQLSR